MQDRKALITAMYEAFNRRDVEGALALMGEGVDWPKASEGGRVVGKEAIRAYWARQWAEFDPRVEPVEFTRDEAGETEVKVHQLVKDRSGTVLWDGMVRHVYRFAGGVIERMDVREGEGAFGR